VSLIGEAIENAADAVFQVVADAARSLAPEDKRGARGRDSEDDEDARRDPADVRH
jgi:hypothetical protein